MRRHAIEATAAALGAIWLAAIAVQLFFVAGLASIPWLIGAIVAHVGVFLVSGSLLLTTNTRRPRGIEPDAPPAVITYGRRSDDAVSVTEELSAVLERAAAQRGGTGRTPDWLRDDPRVTVTKDEG